jgi:uncharacterized protein (TIGR04255 family)
MPMTSAGRTLPDFENPPAVETLLGVRFVPLSSWQVCHYGLFWNRIREQYPRAEVHTAIGSVDAQVVLCIPEEANTEFEVPIRCWFVKRDETTLIQIQRDRFIHNWRKREAAQPYLHYDDLRPDFERSWARFREFVSSEHLGSAKIVECEVTYINHIERGQGWDSFADLPSIVNCWRDSASNFLPNPSLVSFNAVYPITGGDGTLRVALQPAFRPADNKEVLQLTLTGLCRPRQSNDEDILRSLDAARAWVVQGFTDITSSKMHEIWRRKQ